jgi:hypothetical protein
VRRQAVWFVTLPVILAGIEAAHALGNTLSGETKSELFSSPASGGNALPLVAAALAALVAAGLLSRANGSWWESHRSSLVAAPFATLPLVGFFLLELAEAIARHDVLTGLFDSAFFVGMALQLPVALAGWLLARFLLRAADAVCAARTASPPRPGRLLTKRHTPFAATLLPQLVVAASRGRAPPELLLDRIG